ncbi:MAG: DUF1453 family protein [Proteobacteria bacterium]|nr:DUF1453 family protein [Pseudomonadota bacterium]
MSPTQLIITIAVVLVLMALRTGRLSQARPLKTERLWIVPLIFAGVTALTFMQAPPTVHDVPWLIGTAIFGAIVGWYRGKMMRITVDPQTHNLSQAASPLALLFLLALFGLRYGLRYVLGEEAHAWGISVNLLADAPMVFAVAMFALTRVEMFIRAERLLAEARAAHATTPVTAEPGA